MPDPRGEPHPHPASYRDPGGRVYEYDSRILRVLSLQSAGEFAYIRDSGLLRQLIHEEKLIECTELNADSVDYRFEDQTERPNLLLEHPRIPFISYPYEWPFRALQCAALLHLDVHLRALAAGATLSDATAYNVQFVGARPVFIDVSSLRRYREGELWLAHRQFCEQFLNPLLLHALAGVPYQPWYRGALEGIQAVHLARLLLWRSKLHWLVLTHVLLQNRLQLSASRKATADLRAATSRKLPPHALIAMLEQLRRWIGKLRPAGNEASTWANYETTRTYSDEEKRRKLACVSEFVQATQPGVLWDLGCNAGEYSLEAVRSGARYVVGFDCDLSALDEAFGRSQSEGAPFLPLFFDAANPSPSQGWRQRERQGLLDRANCDAVLALAFEHHLTIGRNVPLPEFIDWLTGLAPRGLVEFVEKSDPTIQKMLAMREDIFSGYSLPTFERLLSARARVIRRESLTASGRHLFWYER